MKTYAARYDGVIARSQRGRWGRVVRVLSAGETVEGTPVEGEAIAGCDQWVEADGAYIPLCVLDVE